MSNTPTIEAIAELAGKRACPRMCTRDGEIMHACAKDLGKALGAADIPINGLTAIALIALGLTMIEATRDTPQGAVALRGDAEVLQLIAGLMVRGDR